MAVTPESDIPQSWAWYQDGIKWFIAIAAALIAFGFDRAKDGAIVGLALKFHLFGAVLLGLSAAAGLFTYLQLLGAANLMELENPFPEDEKQLKRFKRWLALGYQVCVGSLMLGVLVSAATWLSVVWREGQSERSAGITVKRLGTGGEVLIIRRGALTEVLTSEPDGTLKWTPSGSGAGSSSWSGTGAEGGLPAPALGKPLLITPHFTILGTGATLDFGQLGKDIVEASAGAGPEATRELIKGIGDGIDTAKKAVDLASSIVELVRRIWPEHPQGGRLPPTCQGSSPPVCSSNQPVGTLIDLKVGFDFNSAHLDKVTVAALLPLAEKLRRQGTAVLIEGHADGVGSATYNVRLSEERADAVRRFLEEHGVSPTGLHTFGYGRGYPWLPYLPKDGTNRRVRVIECTIGSENRCVSEPR
jgi:outer membrane protein OmpA-like peptidoglycan-associated protein